MYIVLSTIAPASASAAEASTASTTFGITTLVTQLKPNPNEWLIAGMAPDPAGGGMLDLVVGGAVRKHGHWQVTMLDRYSTAVVTKPTLDFEVPCKSQVIPTHSAFIVSCLNGGSDFQSFVIVVSTDRALPRTDLAVTCGQTKWTVQGDSLTLVSSTLRGGYEDPGSLQPDIALTWGSSQSPDLQPTTQLGDATFSKDCAALSYRNEGPL